MAKKNDEHRKNSVHAEDDPLDAALDGKAPEVEPKPTAEEHQAEEDRDARQKEAEARKQDAADRGRPE